MGPNDATPSDMTDADAPGLAAAFWRWSLATYDRPDVARMLLAQQDDRGQDVNLVLLCLWAATRGTGLDRPRIVAIAAAARPWAVAAVGPIRVLRRALKAPVPGVEPEAREAVRRHIAGAELDAERVAQSVMVAAAGLPPAAPGVSPETQRRLAALNLANLPDGLAGDEADALIRAALG